MPFASSLWPNVVAWYRAVSGDNELIYFAPVGFWVLQLVVYVGSCVLFTIVDVVQWPRRIYAWKVQPKIEYGSVKNPSLPSTVMRCALAFAVELPALVALQLLTTKIGLGVRCTSELPGHLEAMSHGVAVTLLAEVGFYVTHRMMHWPWLFRHVHRYHHQYKAPMALAAQAQHPVEIVWNTVIGLTAWPFVLRSHVLILFIGAIIGTWGSVHDHCGYWFMGDGRQPTFHDFHHERVNCNYGFLGILDNWMGTDVAWKQVIDERRAAMRARAAKAF